VEAVAALNLGAPGAGGAIGSTQQRVVIGARANASLNVNGGTVNVHVGPGTDTARSFMIGGSAEAGYTGTLNLNAGTLNYGSSAPVSLGTGAGPGFINMVDGHLLVTGTSSLQTGTNDFINFSSGGTGSIAFLGWAASDHANFKALIDAGRIQINGNIVAAGNYGAFIFTTDGDLGVM